MLNADSKNSREANAETEKERELDGMQSLQARGIRRRDKMRSTHRTVTEGKNTMHVAAHTFVGLVVGNRGVPYLMLPFSVTENMRREMSKSKMGNSEKAYTTLTSWRTMDILG